MGDEGRKGRGEVDMEADERESGEKRHRAWGGGRESVAMQIKRCEGETE